MMATVVTAAASENLSSQTETVTYMNPSLYKEAEVGVIGLIMEQAERLHLLVTPNENTVLHIHITSQRDREESTEFVNKILDECPRLLWQANAKGEIPLHLAARYGSYKIVEALIERAKTLHEEQLEGGFGTAGEMVKSTNKHDDTALHEAVRFNHLDIVKLLIEHDPDFSYLHNKAGETPLYLAAERDFGRSVIAILRSCPSPAYEGPNRRTALHAAVLSGNQAMTRNIVKLNGDLAKAVDKQGWTPLHYAVFYGDIEMAKLLLTYDTSAVYLADTDGKRTPLHIAAGQGHREIVELLISCYPDCCERVDKRGWNILHFAVESWNIPTIEVVLENNSLAYLLNEKDNEGNTPLHRVAASDYHGLDVIDCHSVSKLIKDPRVDKMAMNNNNMCAMDVCYDNTSELKTKKRITKYLQKAGAKKGQRNVTYRDWVRGDDEGTDYLSEIKKAKETHLIVAALIATVAFAASFTLPGGYISEKGPELGTAALARQAAFRAFVISNTTAMLLSSSAVFIYIFLAMPLHKSMFYSYFELAAYLNIFATGAMVVAFMTGQYAVLRHSKGLAIAVCVIASCFFFFYYKIFVRSTGMASFLGLLGKAIFGFFSVFLWPVLKALERCLEKSQQTRKVLR